MGYQVLVNYRPTKFTELDLRDVLEKSWDTQIADLVKGKIVVIGVAEGSKDYHLTPYSQGLWSSKMSGVAIHAHQIGQILDVVEGRTRLLWWWSQWQECLWIGIWSGIGGILVLFAKSSVQLTMIQAIAISTLTGATIFLFNQGGWIPLFPPGLALVTTSMIVLYLDKNCSHA